VKAVDRREQDCARRRQSLRIGKGVRGRSVWMQRGNEGPEKGSDDNNLERDQDLAAGAEIGGEEGDSPCSFRSCPFNFSLHNVQLYRTNDPLVHMQYLLMFYKKRHNYVP
jgi:hypothetical protein